ncbi:platelet endothelial aggregation receptor 1-like [Argopecten irradians]|uniref:platelet endothelial aggregation receptor 1-like n=1 Tax=Argopecten irradians TaxID=31199 RepID=UPI00371602DB
MKFIMSCLLVICSVLSIFTAVRASQDLAKGKPTSQSSTRDNYDSSKAIDGCILQYIGSNCCSHTDFGNTEAWWQVDLQQQSVIETVHIIYRDQNLLKRLAGFQIYLSNTSDWRSGVRCYQDQSTSLDLLFAKQYVACQGVAQYLTIYSDRRTHTYTWYSTKAILELCEVYIYGCPLGKFGNGNCNEDCIDCLDSLCHPTSGICDTCASGYYTIEDGCFPCLTNCAGNTCNGTTGACSDGCLPGFSGTYCKCLANCGDQPCSQETCSNCNSGYFGSTCTPCPSGCNASTCDKALGVCTNGCVPGYFGTYCNCPANCAEQTCSQGNCSNCNSGYYGHSCTPCPSGCYGSTCDKSGICANGCSSGFSGTFCNCPVNCDDNICHFGNCTNCNDGFYGPTCTPCPTGCSINTCDKSSGNCLQCDAGFHGSHCDLTCPDNCINKTCNQDNGLCEECKPGFHGILCYQECPINCKNNICNMQDGQCIEREALVTEPESQAGIYAGAGVGALIVIGIVIATVFIVLRRRTLQPKRKMSAHFDGDFETTLSQPSPNHSPDTKSQEVSEPALPLAENTSNEYINVGDVKQEEVVYTNMSNGVTIEEIRAMIPKKKENEDEEFKKEFKLLPWGAVHPHVEGSKPLNKAKNRFKTTFPCMHPIQKKEENSHM